MKKTLPLYIQIKDTLKQQILENELLPGSQIPSERELALMFKVNRMTIKRSLALLENQNFLYRIHGKGTFVSLKNTSNKIEIGESSPIGLKRTLFIEGKTPITKVVSFKQVPNTFACFENSEFLYELRRVRYYDHDPFSLQITFLPYDKFIDAERYDFSILSIYDYLEVKNNVPIRFEKTLTIEPVSNEFKSILNIELLTHLFLLEYKGYSKNNEVIELTYSYFNPVKSKFSFTTNKKNTL